jgi:hypothetical protein
MEQSRVKQPVLSSKMTTGIIRQENPYLISPLETNS